MGNGSNGSNRSKAVDAAQRHAEEVSRWAEHKARQADEIADYMQRVVVAGERFGRMSLCLQGLSATFAEGAMADPPSLSVVDDEPAEETEETKALRTERNHLRQVVRSLKRETAALALECREARPPKWLLDFAKGTPGRLAVQAHLTKRDEFEIMGGVGQKALRWARDWNRAHGGAWAIASMRREPGEMPAVSAEIVELRGMDAVAVATAEKMLVDLAMSNGEVFYNLSPTDPAVATALRDFPETVCLSVIVPPSPEGPFCWDMEAQGAPDCVGMPLYEVVTGTAETDVEALVRLGDVSVEDGAARIDFGDLESFTSGTAKLRSDRPGAYGLAFVARDGDAVTHATIYPPSVREAAERIAGYGPLRRAWHRLVGRG